MEVQVDLRGEYCLLLALLCLIVPLNWIGAMIFAALFHEICHALAVLSFGGKIYRIRIGLSGTIMEISRLCPWKELVCALAGPAGSMVLFSLVRLIPHSAVCALVQGLYNLLPVYPMDGGRVMRCILDIFVPDQKAEKIQRAVEWICCILILLPGILMIAAGKNCLLPVLTAILLLSGRLSRKIPCKDSILRVQ